MRYTLICCLFLFSCQVETSSVELPSKKFFFDLPLFFQQEIAELKELEISGIHKEIVINDKREIQEVHTVELEKELAIFINADINRLAWKDQYQVDSVFNQQELEAIHYTGLKENLKTKKLSVYLKEGQVTQLQIRKGLSNMAAESFQELTYYSRKGYAIINKQSLVFSEEQHIEMKVDYIFESGL